MNAALVFPLLPYSLWSVLRWPYYKLLRSRSYKISTLEHSRMWKPEVFTIYIKTKRVFASCTHLSDKGSQRINCWLSVQYRQNALRQPSNCLDISWVLKGPLAKTNCTIMWSARARVRLAKLDMGVWPLREYATKPQAWLSPRIIRNNRGQMTKCQGRGQGGGVIFFKLILRFKQFQDPFLNFQKSANTFEGVVALL